MEPKEILFVDKKIHVMGIQIILECGLGIRSDTARSLDEAMRLISEKQYACVVVEPFDPPYLGREQESPYIAFMKKLREDGMKIIIGSSYSEGDFQASFGMVRCKNYDGYQGKPWDSEEFKNEVMRVLEGRL